MIQTPPHWILRHPCRFFCTKGTGNANPYATGALDITDYP